MAERCENCGDNIGGLETPHVFGDHVVCEACYSKLTTPVQVSAVAVNQRSHAVVAPAAPTVAVYVEGSRSLPRGQNGMGVASLVLGLCGIFLACFPPIALMASIVGLILGGVAIITESTREDGRLGLPIAGMAVSAVPFVLALLFLFGVMAAVGASGNSH